MVCRRGHRHLDGCRRCIFYCAVADAARAQGNPQKMVGSGLSNKGISTGPESKLLLHFRSPVQNDGQGSRIRFVHFCIDQESLAVGAEIIRDQVVRRNRLAQVSLKQLSRRSRFEVGAGLHRYSHHLPFRRQIEQLLAVSPPARLFTASSGDLPFAVYGRKGRHVDFPIAGLVGRISDPFAIGTKLGVAYDPVSLEQRL